MLLYLTTQNDYRNVTSLYNCVSIEVWGFTDINLTTKQSHLRYEIRRKWL